MNRYQITFERPDGTECSVIGVANNVQYAIQNALRSAARSGYDVSGFKYLRSQLVNRGW